LPRPRGGMAAAYAGNRRGNSRPNQEPFTVDESSFRFAKLIGYKSLADVAGKGSLFVITVMAARRLDAGAFGVFALASTVGWLLAVVTDFGMQLHVARSVARTPSAAGATLAEWLRLRVWTTAGAIAVVAAWAVASRAAAAIAMPMVLFACVYGASGLIEFLHYFYRGLSRSDVESSLILWQRGGTLACGLIARRLVALRLIGGLVVRLIAW